MSSKTCSCYWLCCHLDVHKHHSVWVDIVLKWQLQFCYFSRSFSCECTSKDSDECLMPKVRLHLLGFPDENNCSVLHFLAQNVKEEKKRFQWVESKKKNARVGWSSLKSLRANNKVLTTDWSIMGQTVRQIESLSGITASYSSTTDACWFCENAKCFYSSISFLSLTLAFLLWWYILWLQQGRRHTECEQRTTELR